MTVVGSVGSAITCSFGSGPTPADQLKHMARIAAILEKLDPADRRRAVAWFSDAYAADSVAGRYPVQTQEPS